MSIHENLAALGLKVDALFQMVGDLQKWQSLTVENWMRRVDSLLDTEKWDGIENFENRLTELEETTSISKKLLQNLPTLSNNVTQITEMIDNLNKRLFAIENQMAGFARATGAEVQVFDLEEVMKGIDETLQKDKSDKERFVP